MTVKIFGIGMQKTGTTSLGACLKALGFKHRSYDRNAIWHLRRCNYRKLKMIMDKYDSFEDEPWANLYKIADEMYPEAKFILTVRKSTEVWFNSLANHCDRIPFNEHRKYLLGSMFPRRNKAKVFRRYEQHNAEVLRYFKNRENKLLVISFDGDDRLNIWERICDFLGCENPNIDIPKKNSAPNKKFPQLTWTRVLLYLPEYLSIIIRRDYLKPYLVSSHESREKKNR